MTGEVGKSGWGAFQPAAQYLGVTTAVLYVAGFAMVNAYLGGYGLRDLELFRANYIVAGASFAIIAGVYGFFVGTKLWDFEEDNDNVEKGLKEANPERPLLTAVATFIYGLSNVAFGVVVTHLVLVPFLFAEFPKSLAYVFVAIAPYMLAIQLMGLRGPPKEGHRTGALTGVLLIGIFQSLTALLYDGFVVEGLSEYARSLWRQLTFVTISYLMLVWFAKTYWPHSYKRIFAWWLSLTILGSTLTLGSKVYGHIRVEAGGGRPQAVWLQFARELDQRNLIDALGIKDKRSAELQLIAETSKEVIVRTNSNETKPSPVIRLDKSLIAAIYVAPPMAPERPVKQVVTPVAIPSEKSKTGERNTRPKESALKPKAEAAKPSTTPVTPSPPIP